MVYTEVEYVTMVKRLLDELSRELGLPEFQRKSTQMFVNGEYTAGDWIYDIDNGHLITIWLWGESGAVKTNCQGPLPIVASSQEVELRADLKNRINTLLSDTE
jgi:hypothetical protein